MCTSHFEVHSKLATRFSLVYSSESVVYVEVMVPSARVSITGKLANPHDLIDDVVTLEERRQNGESESSSY